MIRRLLAGLALAGAVVATPLAAGVPASAAADPAPAEIVVAPATANDPTPEADETGEITIRWISPARCQLGGGVPVRVIGRWGFCRGGVFNGFPVRFF
ncbi:hypothetical protein ACFYY8_12940 [Streptosporangium sp. NPDC001559]|uniref:hypothetical protein n=1 Tax=Streptosporangium sp. NPDC001559 TaxID=3366187 RepID=UPI0036E9F812